MTKRIGRVLNQVRKQRIYIFVSAVVLALVASYDRTAFVALAAVIFASKSYLDIADAILSNPA